MFSNKKVVNNVKTNEKKGLFIWVLWFFAAMVLVFSSVRNVRKILLIRKQLEDQKRVVLRMEAENRKLQESILSTQKVDFLENEARNKLGLVKEGETVVVLPPEDVLIKLAPRPEEEGIEEINPNWRQWLRLFVN